LPATSFPPCPQTSLSSRKRFIFSKFKLINLALSTKFSSGYELSFLWYEFNRVSFYHFEILYRLALFKRKNFFFLKGFTACLLGVNFVGWMNILFGKRFDVIYSIPKDPVLNKKISIFTNRASCRIRILRFS
jgi:hypothetical protein